MFLVYHHYWQQLNIFMNKFWFPYGNLTPRNLSYHRTWTLKKKKNLAWNGWWNCLPEELWQFTLPLAVHKSSHLTVFATTRGQINLPSWWESNYLPESGLPWQKEIRALAGALQRKLDLHPSVSKKEEPVRSHTPKRNQVPALLQAIIELPPGEEEIL